MAPREDRKAAHPGAVNARSDAARCPTGRRTAVSSRNSSAAEASSALTGRGRAPLHARHRGFAGRHRSRAALSDASRGSGACHGRSQIPGERTCKDVPAPPAVRRAPCATTRASGGLEVRAGARAVYMFKRSRWGKIAEKRRCAQSTGRATVTPTSRRSEENNRARITRRRAGELRSRGPQRHSRVCAYRRNVIREGGSPRD
jgi:hypothetical protein